MDDCIFCRIANGEIPAEKVLETEEIVAFRDINPVSPTHVLIVPRRHITSMNDEAGSGDLFGAMLLAAREVAKKEGISEEGYRIVVNTNKGAGQEVFHLHMHVMGGRPLKSMG